MDYLIRLPQDKSLRIGFRYGQTRSDLLLRITEATGLPSDDIRVFRNGNPLETDQDLPKLSLTQYFINGIMSILALWGLANPRPPQFVLLTLVASPRTVGGKGGFGALLKKGSKKKKTREFGDMRTLTGERVRLVEARDKLKEWLSTRDAVKEKEEYLAMLREDMEKAELNNLRTVDESLLKKLERTEAEMPDAVESGFVNLLKEYREAEERVKAAEGENLEDYEEELDDEKSRRQLKKRRIEEESEAGVEWLKADLPGIDLASDDSSVDSEDEDGEDEEDGKDANIEVSAVPT